MQIEDNTKKMQFFFIVEMQLSLFKEDIFAGKDKARKGSWQLLIFSENATTQLSKQFILV